MSAGDESLQPASAAKPTAAGAKKPAAPHAAVGISEARSLYDRFVEVVERDGRFPFDAYRFLQEALEFTVRKTHGSEALRKARPGQPDPRHVSGQQLCLGLRDLALQRWGRMAKAVLNSWGIHSTRNLGEMVFVLVENGFLRKTDQDHAEDFEDVFDFPDLEHLYTVPAAPLAGAQFDYAGDTGSAP